MSNDHTADNPGTPASVIKQVSADETVNTRAMQKMLDDVSEHGEVHAKLDSGRELEVRLGTARFNFDVELIEVWDGDAYIPHAFSHVESWYKPYDIYH